MFKKVVIADRLAVYVNAVYANPAGFPAAALALATLFFAFQIYCDFSGYSDIAIGCARAWGVLHGIYQVIERMSGKRPADGHGRVRMIITFVLVCLAWVFFRAGKSRCAARYASEAGR